MKAQLLVLRVGYMVSYDGPNTISGGGAYIAEHGVGGEVFNFKPSRGKCYGYAMSLHGSGLNLAFIDDSQDWEVGDELPGVDVVFIARRPGFGQVVVGWYRNATVFHRQYRVRRGSIPGMSESRTYLCVAKSSDVCLLPESGRIFSVPYAPAGAKGFPGQSNVWYPHHRQHEPGVLAFMQKLIKYMSASRGLPLVDDDLSSADGRKGKGQSTQPDHAHNARVEAAAVKAVWANYRAKGFTLKSVETDCVGWDLEARKGRETLRLEVKGSSGADIYFELTPNEYLKLSEYASSYRVCMVCEALSRPRIFDLKPKQVSGRWSLTSASGDVTVALRERTAAVGTEVATVES